MGEQRGGSLIAGHRAIHDGNIENKVKIITSKDLSKVTKSNIDSNGYYRTIEYFREDGSLSVKSVASVPNGSGLYTKLLVTHFDYFGNILSNIEKTVVYDAFGSVKEVQ